MITSQESEALAQKYMQDYIAQCKCYCTDDVVNALMKLATIGQLEAVARLQGTANYIAKTEAGKNWNMDKAH